MTGRMSTNAGLLRRMAEEEAVLFDAQAWLYGIHTRLLNALVTKNGWNVILSVPKHIVKIADDYLLVSTGTGGVVVADTLLAVLVSSSSAAQGTYPSTE